MSRLDYLQPAAEPQAPLPRKRKRSRSRRTPPQKKTCARCFNRFPLDQPGLYCGDKCRAAAFAFVRRLVDERDARRSPVRLDRLEGKQEP